MKSKFFAVLMALVMALTLIPFGAMAEENYSSNDTTLLDKAVAAFPEYAEKLLNPSPNSSVFSRSAETRTVVVNETRAISEDETITYTEYSDGLILLSGCELDYESDCPGGGGLNKDITINVTATCVNGSYYGYFYLDGVTYRLNSGINNWDKISNTGTARKGSNCLYYNLNKYELSETPSNYAYIIYALSFRIGSTSGAILQTYLTISVGEDTAVIGHSSNN